LTFISPILMANESVEKPFFEEKFSGLKVQKNHPDD
jgi:hypothetical protein